jgi:methionine-rich copper-binding protein CopC
MISTPTLTARRTPLRMVACIAATIALAGAASTALATPAWAHDGLVSSTPAAGEVVTEVSGLTLTFSEVLLDLGGGSNAFALRVSDVDENYYESGCITLDGSTVSSDAALGAAGEYEVLWQVVSSDGHPTSGSYSFDYQPSPGTPEASGSTSPASCASGNVPASTAAPSITDESPLSADEQDTVLRTMGIAAVIALVLGIGGVILLARRYDRRKTKALEAEKSAEDHRLALPDLDAKHGHTDG